VGLVGVPEIGGQVGPVDLAATLGPAASERELNVMGSPVATAALATVEANAELFRKYDASPTR
jgi:hypothetical protein